MDLIRADTVAALHRAMVVLRQELEMKNKTIRRLRKRKHNRNSSSNPAFHPIEDLPKPPVKTSLCLSVRRISEVRH